MHVCACVCAPLPLSNPVKQLECGFVCICVWVCRQQMGDRRISKLILNTSQSTNYWLITTGLLALSYFHTTQHTHTHTHVVLSETKKKISQKWMEGCQQKYNLINRNNVAEKNERTGRLDTHREIWLAGGQNDRGRDVGIWENESLLSFHQSAHCF